MAKPRKQRKRRSSALVASQRSADAAGARHSRRRRRHLLRRHAVLCRRPQGRRNRLHGRKGQRALHHCHAARRAGLDRQLHGVSRRRVGPCTATPRSAGPVHGARQGLDGRHPDADHRAASRSSFSSTSSPARPRGRSPSTSTIRRRASPAIGRRRRSKARCSPSATTSSPATAASR